MKRMGMWPSAPCILRSGEERRGGEKWYGCELRCVEVGEEAWRGGWLLCGEEEERRRKLLERCTKEEKNKLCW